MSDQYFKLIGKEELLRILRGLLPLMRRTMLRPALRAGAKVVLDAALPVVPVLQRPVYRRGQLIRTPGLLRSRLVIRTSKEATKAGDVGVFVNIRPANPGDRGRYSPVDPYYWRWITFKTKKNPNPREFLQAGAAQLEGAAFKALEEDLAKRMKKLNQGGQV